MWLDTVGVFDYCNRGDLSFPALLLRYSRQASALGRGHAKYEVIHAQNTAQRMEEQMVALSSSPFVTGRYIDIMMLYVYAPT